MMRTMSRRSVLFATLVLGCGGRAPAPQVPQGDEIRLEPVIAGQQWYRAVSTCAQGPFEVEVPATGAKWGEDIELRLHTPRRVGLHAVILVDGKETEVQDAVFDSAGTSGAKPENARCIADAKERLVLGRAGGGGGTGTPGTPGTPGTLVVPPPDRPTTTPQLDLDTSLVTTSTEIVKLRLRDRPTGAPAPRITIRFWSVDPNDLEGVLFGWAHIEWRPNVPEDRYEAHLRWQADQLRLAQTRREEDQRRADEEWRRTHPPQAPRPAIVVKVDVEAQLVAERKREEARRRREIAAALEAERRLRRQEFCAAHPKDRDCWGAGGLAIHLELERHRQERDAYCAQHTEDARCWSDQDWQLRRTSWQARLTTALAPPRPPEGPPPAALAEEIPPRLSVHAEWRPGYWQWAEGTWVWLAGMWRVPDADIASEQTTTAPAAPPPVQVEVAPVAPVRTAVWIPGFWQWGGASWVWISGSWQLRPEPRVTWRAPEWRARGSVHVLIPGGWIHLGGGR